MSGQENTLHLQHCMLHQIRSRQHTQAGRQLNKQNGTDVGARQPAKKNKQSVQR